MSPSSPTHRPYCPFLNPIEDAFTEVKAYIRRHYERAILEPLLVIEEALESVSAENAASYFRNAGYLPPVESGE